MLRKTVRAWHADESGFTLLELLLALGILAVLAGAAVFGRVSDMGRAAACAADVRTVEIAQEAYYSGTSLGNGRYAPNAAALVAARLLRDVPDAKNGYAITTDTTGVVIATGSCTNP